MPKNKKYIPFGYKLMLSYSAIIIVPVLLVGYFANSVFVDSIREQTRSAIQGTLKQVTDNIAYRLEDTKRLSDMLYYDESLADHLRNYEAGWVGYETTTKYLQPKFRTTVEATNRKIWLSIYLHNETLPEIYSDYNGMDPLQSKNRLYDWYHIKRIVDKDWYADYPAEVFGETLQWRTIEDDDEHGRISLLRRIVDFKAGKVTEIGFIRISVHLADLFQSVDYRKIGEGTTLLISDDRDRVVVSSGEIALPKGVLWTNTDTSDDLVIDQPLPALGWHLTALVPKSITDGDTNKVRLLTILVCLGCVVVFSFVGMLVSRFFARRVHKVVAVLESFRGGEFHKRMQYKGRDEFHQIAVALNEMGGKTQQLFEEVYATNLRKTEAELESLQAQINPHFLYNTLSSISRLAKFGQVDTLHEMVRRLATFYRLSLNEGRKIIPVYRELEQAQAYLDIEKIKHGDRLSIQFDVSADVFRYDTIKLVLQPFIENVLKHGWIGDRIHIRIVAEKDQDTIVFQVIDDGTGIMPGRLKELRSSDGFEGAGYGIRNVEERIKLYYGNKYGVSISSKPGIGTAVTIVIPCMERMYENGKSTNDAI
ncbi:sensor histidine kinase [Cohnella sp. GCM10027633]|uniref:sensor histidine kinase n=1 Tax=unclassified Cohnella TaxID=2636738 RepID=UPI0036455B60